MLVLLNSLWIWTALRAIDLEHLPTGERYWMYKSKLPRCYIFVRETSPAWHRPFRHVNSTPWLVLCRQASNNSKMMDYNIGHPEAWQAGHGQPTQERDFFCIESISNINAHIYQCSDMAFLKQKKQFPLT